MNVELFRRNGTDWVRHLEEPNPLFTHCAGAEEILFSEYERREIASLLLYHGVGAVAVADIREES